MAIKYSRKLVFIRVEINILAFQFFEIIKKNDNVHKHNYLN